MERTHDQISDLLREHDLDEMALAVLEATATSVEDAVDWACDGETEEVPR